MKHFAAIVAAVLLCASAGQAQTLKSLMWNSTNGQVIASTGTNNLKFTNNIKFDGDVTFLTPNDVRAHIQALGYNDPASSAYELYDAALESTVFDVQETSVYIYPSAVSDFRNELGLSSFRNGTGTNSAVIGAESGSASGQFSFVVGGINNTASGQQSVVLGGGANTASGTNSAVISGSSSVANAVSAVAMGHYAVATNNGAFVWSDFSSTNQFFSTNENSFNVRANGGSRFVGGMTSEGNITVTQTTASNGLLFVYRTNNEAFLGLANLIASNNTTLSNETLFRVGTAEATNKSAQFGFRTVRTNNGGEGLAVFSVFGYNALMMIGPSDRSRTNTATNAGIEADIWTITPTNRVMTLRDTNSGAVTLHQELGFSTNNITTNAPANTTNVALWLRVWVGTNNYRLPLYQ